MQFEKMSKIQDLILCKPKVHSDDRGYFVETFRQDKLDEFLGFCVKFTQDNESKSSYGVLRGLHFQLPPFAQSKLVRVIEGEVLDVAVDIRVGSPTFGQFESVILNDKNKHQFFIPRGFAHGFVVLSKEAIFAYKVDNFYSRECDRGILFIDFGVDWKVPQKDLILSNKDLIQPRFKDADKLFDYSVNYYV
ncbi:MAG: dTDP-4-dehydrorhamnose 3,5-epimerase [Campylobacteraceae bacterium]